MNKMIEENEFLKILGNSYDTQNMEYPIVNVLIEYTQLGVLNAFSWNHRITNRGRITGGKADNLETIEGFLKIDGKNKSLILRDIHEKNRTYEWKLVERTYGKETHEFISFIDEKYRVEQRCGLLYRPIPLFLKD